MVGPEAAASAGASGCACSCPWPRGRCLLRGRRVVVCSEAAALMMNLLQVVRDHWIHVLVPVGFVFGYYLDKKNDEKLTAFRNKSLLYERELKPNEEVTWK
ncbi:NADH dehydrogenase [ubiquinone] 1 beta subcomplex subunit 1 [Budorcas taxicolor]|uniref:NADH dehydrogenase [ubiquinone] 1 beta subcomplex subunit 1 n=1 Tax=Budorcas taxicolor TaxID=37181 RepID=UPI0022833915|nr:NADH dehydrogenase [ubiquinone] 1 beta subcomplex subunit 1 [Budorcas taxicolor]